MPRISQSWPDTKLDGKMSAQESAWERARQSAGRLTRAIHPFITISREYGCDEVPLAQPLAEELNGRFQPTQPWVVYDRELLSRAAEALHVRRDIIETLDGRYRDAMTEFFDAILNRKIDEALVFRKLAEVVRSVALHGHAILLGRGGYLITQDLKTGLHVRLVAPRAWRVHHLAESRQISISEAEHALERGQRERDQFIQRFFVLDPEQPFLHDLVIDVSRFNPAQLTEAIIDVLTVRFGAGLCGA